MSEMLDAIEAADALVLGSPMNFSTVTAVTKRFIERLICLSYWPWGSHIPKARIKTRRKPSVIIASSSAPSFFFLFSPGMRKLMRDAIKLVGGKVIGEIRVGMAARQRQPREMERNRKQARRLGRQMIERLPTQCSSGG
jgi:NAD(P)H-dependent FMN reductase